jgi:arginase
MFEITGVPFDLAGKHLGSRLAPVALRLAGLHSVFEQAKIPFVDQGDLSLLPPLSYRPPHGTQVLVENYVTIKQATETALTHNHIPILLGGDHSIAIGSVSAALERYKEKLALLWLDAHGDINTPTTSPSGNLHGMTLAALMQFSSSPNDHSYPGWDTLLHQVGPQAKLRPEQIAWMGLRDLDPAEEELLGSFNGASFIASTQQIVTRGIDAITEDFHQWMENRRYEYLWISFDIDLVDPVFAPGTGTPAQGGLSLEQVRLLTKELSKASTKKEVAYGLAGIDIVEVNPLRDHENQTTHVALEWLRFLLGVT